jgi:hypothetical protein
MKKPINIRAIPVILALLLLLPGFTSRAAFPLSGIQRSEATTIISGNASDTVSVWPTEYKNAENGHKNHKIRSGIFGRLSLYFSLLSFIGFIVAVCSIHSPLLGVGLVVWLYGATFAVISGLIGLHHRRKKGMAIAGIVIGVLQFALLAAIASFFSAVAAALPGIMVAIMILGHGA